MKTISKKICLLGDSAVGKTSLVRRFVYSLFSDKYISTLGVKVSHKAVTVPGSNNDIVEVKIMLWDLSGNEQPNPARASYLRGASGAVLVCDLTRPKTLDNLHTYAHDLLNISPTAQLILAANKCDLIDQQQLTPVQIETVAAALNTPFYLTSAKLDEQVETIFRHLARMLI